MSNIIDRVEQVDIKLVLDKLRSVERHKLALTVLLPYTLPRMSEGDTLEVTWHFVIQYLYDTALKLEAIKSICEDPEVVISADCEALKTGEILIYTVLAKLHAVMDRLAQQELDEILTEANKEVPNDSAL
jgi:hypothetical protein